MTISLKAYSPADGTAVIKKNNALMLLSAPYRLGSTLNVKNLPDDEERTLADAILRQHFYAADEDFDNWDFVFAFLREKLIDYREQMGRPVPKIDGIEIINSMADNVLQRLLDKAKNELIPQQRFIHARNFLQNILASDADAGLKAQAKTLLDAAQLAEQSLLNPATIDLAPDLQIRLQDTVNRLSPDGQRLFINWLLSGIASQQWDVPKLMVILQDEPLELISDDDVIINIVAQVLRSAVVLFDTRKWRGLLKKLISQLIFHLKTVDENRFWENDFFDIAIECELDEWAIESLPRLIISEEMKDEVLIKIVIFIVICLPTEEVISSIYKAESSYATLKMPKETFKLYSRHWEEIEKQLLSYDSSNICPTKGQRKATKLHILSNIKNGHISFKTKECNPDKLNHLFKEIQSSTDTDRTVYSSFRAFLDKQSGIHSNNTPYCNA